MAALSAYLRQNAFVIGDTTGNDRGEFNIGQTTGPNSGQELHGSFYVFRVLGGCQAGGFGIAS